MLRVVLLLILVLFAARAFWRVVDGILETVSGPRTPAKPGVPMARDPVCGTFVVAERAVTLRVGAKLLHFCSTECRDKYAGRAGRAQGRTA